jgi:DNA gyrase subunit A
MVLLLLLLRWDELLEAKLTNGESQIILAVKSGKLVRLKRLKPSNGKNSSGSWNYFEG